MKNFPQKIYFAISILCTLLFTTSIFLESSHDHKVGKNSSCQVCIVSYDKTFDKTTNPEIKISFQKNSIKIQEPQSKKFIAKTEKNSRAPPEV
jgi:uncharacterized membrane protein